MRPGDQIGVGYRVKRALQGMEVGLSAHAPKGRGGGREPGKGGKLSFLVYHRRLRPGLQSACFGVWTRRGKNCCQHVQETPYSPDVGCCSLQATRSSTDAVLELVF